MHYVNEKRLHFYLKLIFVRIFLHQHLKTIDLPNIKSSRPDYPNEKGCLVRDPDGITNSEYKLMHSNFASISIELN